MTATLTTLTVTAASTADYAISTLVTGGYKFNTLGEAQSFLQVIYNLQVRLLEVEANLEECGLMAAS